MPSAAERPGPMRYQAMLLGLLVLAGCAGAPDRPRGSSGGYRPVADLPVRIGPPYTVRGRTYVPVDERGYDAVGMASWYGSESGSRTANGERFRPDWIGGAHRTLPLPSYVEVTALGTGRTILVRINDRGPFAADRIIDLSRGAARLLGIERDGRARVRVRRVFPDERDRAALRAGRPAAPRTGQYTTLLAVRTVPIEVDSATDAGLYVQVATLSSPDRADRLARDLGGTVTRAGVLFRVRIGPVTPDDAQPALARVRAAGYQDARLVRDPGPTPQFMEPVR
ncbi:septal ring lytic transglycosylase RlpA family protein [Sphingomonas montana]|uniref:septal ring lytic transglycosylase RlpA family protein n=1 Tax=Sphingomonas montana TaxID=1843236 RepID=UPI001F0A1F80|nr:septal ring lytic transglycosylase RlpA family protein [Sphingomonas montana]